MYVLHESPVKVLAEQQYFACAQMLEQIKREASAPHSAAGARVSDPIDVVATAIENAKPLIETRPVRVGGSIYQVCGGSMPVAGRTLS